jgi:hypothetical protein
MVEDILADDPRRQMLDDGADAGRAKALVELAPPDNAAVGSKLEKVLIAPPGVAAQDFETGDLHHSSPFSGWPGQHSEMGSSAHCPARANFAGVASTAGAPAGVLRCARPITIARGRV